MNKTRITLAIGALGALALTGCTATVEPEADAAPATAAPAPTAAPTTQAPTTTAAPATTEAPGLTDAEIEILSMDMAWAPEDVCPPYNDLRDSGMDLDILNDFLISQFEDGYDQPLSAAGRAHLIELVSAC